MKLTTIISLACFLGSMSFALQAKAQPLPEGWKTECVGYFQIGLPGEIDIGVTLGDIDPSKGTHKIFHSKTELFASSIYIGDIRTSSVLPESSFSGIKDERAKQIENLKLRMKTDPSIKILAYEAAQNSVLSFFTSKQRVHGSIFIYQAGRIYSYLQSDDETKNIKDYINANLVNFIGNFRARALYEVPEEKGFCMPYGFVKDDRPQKRSMGTIMRLKDHPDVKILFRDQSASFMKNYSDEENASVEQELRTFWERPDWGGVKYQALGFRKFPSVQMGGYKGQSTFVEITRPSYSPIYECAWDEEYFSKAEKKRAGCLPPTLDYGYIAYVKGDPDAKEDTPNLLLYVMQNSKDAPDGKPTIGKDELKKMADTIAASIKRR